MGDAPDDVPDEVAADLADQDSRQQDEVQSREGLETALMDEDDSEAGEDIPRSD